MRNLRLWVAKTLAAAIALALLGSQPPASGLVWESAPPLHLSGDAVVLAPIDSTTAPTPTAAGLSAAMAAALADPALGPEINVAVVDAPTGETLFERGGSTPTTPASTTKLLTAAAALTAYGADTRLATRVVLGSTPQELVLVGGGDPLLMVATDKGAQSPRASLMNLARKTAEQLKNSGQPLTAPFQVRYDDSLFTGPTFSPDWPASYRNAGVVVPITALMADRGYVDGIANPDPAAAAAAKFRQLLANRGIKVAQGIVRQSAPAAATELAAVWSVPMSLIVQHTLERSDNTAAEMLGHLAGVALGGEGSFAGGVTATLKVLDELGVSTTGVSLDDASGLSRADRIPPLVLGGLMGAVSRNANPQIWAVNSGVPVAGFTGTLDDRFSLPATMAGRGLVRAKTGTLTGVSTLSGYVTDADGAVLTFAFMAPKATSLISAANAWDRAATALARCGCK